ncbi:type I DNA topoisomerase [Campylobacter sp. FMV-PI01]|uniref:DNA topoisomerase 1 n=1 Tax=Campylobacter portucalensis TaxID=2608384 RepID=A0A6L5WIT1_9BACT|nr:type I DNA topoisomerase [Campylobacter portucalensis]MSN95905.1 type I DNA topoisomerase [Campylobacter portucalensis]
MKNLVIVESPAKAKTIKKFLGSDYEVVASKGHIRDLPKTTFGIKIDNNKFIPEYKISSDHSDIVKNIKNLAKSATNIYLATDEDREGEAIAYHIAIAIGKDPKKLPRIVFHEITKDAILNAVSNPRNLDMNSVDAQQTRRLLDRIVGYKLSPLLNQKIRKGLSAGRVQSAALKIVVDKEREIKAFKPVEYHSIEAIFKKDLDSELIKFKAQKIEKLSIKTEKEAIEIVEAIKKEEFKVKDIEKKQRKTNPNPPFMTSTLQQAASSNLNFSPKKTMILAQSLYEGVNSNHGGLITYMRTDSLNLSKEAVLKARELIEQNFGDKYLPKSPVSYTTKNKSAQEAHEAIRPTDINYTPQLAHKELPKDEAKLYELIYNRFLACQMTPSISEIQSVFISGQKSEFKISGRVVLFDGFYKVYGDLDKDKIIPNFEIGDEIILQKISSKQNFTEPPARYSEASLIKKLESLGIGRPSTYAPTISLLTARNYVEIEKKQIVPTEISFTIIELLENHFKNIVDSEFTSKMEEKLDQIAENKANWQEILSEFYYPFMDEIAQGKTSIKSQKTTQLIGEKCPDCGGDLVKRSGKFGEFVACLNFPKCKYSRNLNQTQQKEKKEPTKIGIKCPKCNDGDIVERFSKRGKFYGCSNYPKCNFISNLEPTNEPCTNCNESNLMKKELKSGTFLECPKCKFKKQID